jgi:hypothetical protein
VVFQHVDWYLEAWIIPESTLSGIWLTKSPKNCLIRRSLVLFEAFKSVRVVFVNVFEGLKIKQDKGSIRLDFGITRT